MSPLRDTQRERGAVFNAEGIPAHFGDAVGEYAAAANNVALFDLTGRGRIAIRGEDRHAFLHNFCTNEIKNLAPGSGCEAFITNIKGRVLGHGFVFADKDVLWFETVAASIPVLIAHLNRYVITEDVTLEDGTNKSGELLLSGPECESRLADLGLPFPSPLLAHEPIELTGSAVTIHRVDWLGEPAALLVANGTLIPQVWQFFVDVGVTPAGEECFQALRIATSFPIYGRDITDDHIAQEVARTDRAINFTKGCYLGQEPIARIDAMGHVNRELRALKILAETALPTGTAILDDAGNPVGNLTSSASVPGADHAVGLGYLRRSHLKMGTTVRLATSDESSVSAVVLEKP